MVFNISFSVEAKNMLEAVAAIQDALCAPDITLNTTVDEPEAPTAAPQEETAPAHTEPEPDLPSLRAALTALRKAKGADAAKALLEKHGVLTLSELPPEKYARVKADAEKEMP